MTRKILPTLLAVAIAVSLSACVDENPPANGQETSATTVSTTRGESVTPGDHTPDEVPLEAPAPANADTGAADPTAPADPVASAITADQAQAIALAHAGLTDATVRRIEIEPDRERGIKVFEVEFDHGGYEYAYDIHAETGEILWSEKEIDD